MKLLLSGLNSLVVGGCCAQPNDLRILVVHAARGPLRRGWSLFHGCIRYPVNAHRG